jgi:hypothetical protein
MWERLFPDPYQRIFWQAVAMFNAIVLSFLLAAWIITRF